MAIATFRKLGDNAMNGFNANQNLLLKAVFSLRPLKKYETLSSFFDTSALKILYPSTGRPPIPYEVLFKALVYKNIKNVSYLSDLVRELQDNPDLALVFGFHPLHLPFVENFSAFLGDTENSIFQKVRDYLVSKLIDLKEIKGTYLTGVRGLQVVSIHCTIARITILLVALIAAKTGNKDKIRFIKSFLPNI